MLQELLSSSSEAPRKHGRQYIIRSTQMGKMSLLFGAEHLISGNEEMVKYHTCISYYPVCLIFPGVLLVFLIATKCNRGRKGLVWLMVWGTVHMKGRDWGGWFRCISSQKAEIYGSAPKIPFFVLFCPGYLLLECHLTHVWWLFSLDHPSMAYKDHVHDDSKPVKIDHSRINPERAW